MPEYLKSITLLCPPNYDDDDGSSDMLYPRVYVQTQKNKKILFHTESHRYVRVYSFND